MLTYAPRAPRVPLGPTASPTSMRPLPIHGGLTWGGPTTGSPATPAAPANPAAAPGMPAGGLEIGDARPAGAGRWWKGQWITPPSSTAPTAGSGGLFAGPLGVEGGAPSMFGTGYDRRAARPAAAPRPVSRAPLSMAGGALGMPHYTGATTGGQEASNYARNLDILRTGDTMQNRVDQMFRGTAAGSANHTFADGSGGAGGGAAGGGGLAGSYADAFGAAKEANEKRYEDILGGYRNRYERGLKSLEGQGSHERNRLNQQFNEAGSARAQGLVGGAYNTTVRANLARGNERERAEAMGGLDSRLRRERGALDADLSKDTFDFMERRNDSYPELDQMNALLQAYGKGGIEDGAGSLNPGGFMDTSPIFQSAQQAGYSIPGYLGGGGGGMAGGFGGYRGRTASGGGQNTNRASILRDAQMRDRAMRRKSIRPGQVWDDPLRLGPPPSWFDEMMNADENGVLHPFGR